MIPAAIAEAFGRLGALERGAGFSAAEPVLTSVAAALRGARISAAERVALRTRLVEELQRIGIHGPAAVVDGILMAAVGHAAPGTAAGDCETVEDVLAALADFEDGAASMSDLAPYLERIREVAEGDEAATSLQWAALTQQLRRLRVPKPQYMAAETLGLATQHDKNKKDLGGSALEPRTEEETAGPVDGRAMLADVEKVLRRYMYLDAHTIIAIILWVVLTYCATRTEAFGYAAILAVTSPTKRCGKTRLRSLLHCLCSHPLPAENVSSAAVYRVLATCAWTLLIDESDRFLREREELIGVLNAGVERGGQVLRCVGDDYEVRGFPVFGPKLLAGIRTLPSTLADRAVPARLERVPPSAQRMPRLRVRQLERDLAGLRGSLARWAIDHADALDRADPADVPELDDRAADVWRPLFAIAEEVGGPWPALARGAALHLTGHDARAEADDLHVQLLRDVRDVLDRLGLDRIASAHLCDELAKIETSPWAEVAKGKPITPTILARRLRSFGIRPKVVRIGDRTPSGYERSAFLAAWERYATRPQTSTGQQSNNDGGFSEEHGSTEKSAVGPENREKCSNGEDVGGVGGWRGVSEGRTSKDSPPDAGEVVDEATRRRVAAALDRPRVGGTL